MSGRRNVLDRIAAALERLAPPVPEPVDWTGAPAYVWGGEAASALPALNALPLATLRGIEEQKAAVRDNLDRLARGSAAHDTLLWGARGMGKSALIRSAVADIQNGNPAALALVQVSGGEVLTVSRLFKDLSRQSRAFLLFFDDLGFGEGQKAQILALRSLLDGGAIVRPPNVRIAVTANRRAILSRDPNENEALHARDERDDALALADRFGLTLGFHPCDRETYLEILSAYTKPLSLDYDEEEALAWAIARGNRSGRTAYQFATELAGRAGLSLDPA